MARYIHFDWAMKRMLRDKANFGILEGFLTSLFERNIKIDHLLESEGNQEHAEDKFNRVDLIARDDNGDTYAIEIQNTRELNYFHRMLYGVSKFITEHINKGQDYATVRKIYSINIVYFDLGQGKDYVYHGYTEFHGLHDKNDILHLSEHQKEQFGVGKTKDYETPGDLMPEYYILRVEDFDHQAVTPLDEWIEFLKTGEIPETVHAPGLTEARQKLVEDKMTDLDRRAYLRHIENRAYQRSVIQTGIIEGRAEGRAEGLAEGLAKGLAKGRAEGLAEGIEKGIEQIVIAAFRRNIPIEQIELFSGLSREKILEIINPANSTI
jgi:predicted transposase/invertase (TIGR01784 family)